MILVGIPGIISIMILNYVVPLTVIGASGRKSGRWVENEGRIKQRNVLNNFVITHNTINGEKRKGISSVRELLYRFCYFI